MRHSWLQYLLILLFAGQSVMAVADMHPLDQLGGTYSDLGYKLGLLNEIDTSSSKNTSTQNPDFTVVDCLDCSNCYCCSYITLPDFNLNTSFDGAGQFIVDYESSIFEIPRSPFLRPPKA